MSRPEAAYLALIVAFYLIFAASLARAAIVDTRRGRHIARRDDTSPGRSH